MKTQVAWNWKAARTELVVSSQKGERLDAVEAEWLRNPPTEHLLPVFFEYEQARARKIVLRYDIMGKTKLRKLLKARVMETSVFLQLLEGLERVANVCSASNHLLDRMLFDPEHVYIDEQKKPYFVLVPFTGMVYNKDVNTPFVMISAMCNPRRMRVQSSEGERLREALWRYTLQEKAFSANAMRRIINNEITESKDLDGVFYDEPSTAISLDDDSAPYFINDLFLQGVTESSSANSAYAIRRADTNQVVEIPAGKELSIGRSGACDVVFEGNPYMGRKHLTIMVVEDGAIITDCASANGTFAYNKRLAPGVPIRISAGDFFLVGGERFYFLANHK